MTPNDNRRILLVDDNASIHQDFRKVLAGFAQATNSAKSSAESALFGDDEAAPSAAPPTPATSVASNEYSIDSAMQGEEALQRVIAARKEGKPYAMAFVDVRMPPGWDGVETTRKLWEADPDLQIVICTAFSDYSWPQTVSQLGRTDRLLILKKPFDAVEVCQLAAALTEKWNLLQRERTAFEAAVRAEKEARSYAASLETVNRALESSWAKSESELQRQRDFLMRMASDVLAPAQLILLQQLDATALARGDATALLSLDRISEPAAAIVSALGSVLELVALDSGAARPQLVPCSPRSIASDVVERARTEATQRGIELSLLCLDGVPEAINSDPARLRRVLGELVGNALRHTPQGSVEIALQPLRDSLAIHVTDSGPGLSRDAVEHLFEPFSDGAPRPDRTRVGLGLVVAKRNAVLLGGDLSYELSEVPQGARFSLTLPTR